jgi:hypothetical protein
MACIGYSVTVTTPDRPATLVYVDCNASTQRVNLQQGSTTVIFAESLVEVPSNLLVTPNITDSESFDASARVTFNSTSGNTTVPPSSTSDTTVYYQLVPCDGTNTVIYTTRAPLVTNERVTVGNPQSVGVGPNVFFTYTREGRLTRNTNPGVMATSVQGTGASGCPDTRPTFSPINLGFDNITSASACFRFSNRTIPITQYYINSNSLQTATFIATDSTGLNIVSDGFYTDGTYYIEIRNGVVSPARLCQNIPPSVDIDNTIGGDSPFIGAPITAYLVRSCQNPNKIWTVQRPNVVNRERIIIESYSALSLFGKTSLQRETFTYTGQTVNTVAGTQILGNAIVGLFIQNGRTIIGDRAYEIIQTGGVDCETESKSLEYAAIRSCETNETAYIPAQRNFENEQIQIGNELWYFTSPATARRPPEGSRLITQNTGIVRTGRLGCDTGIVIPPDDGGPIEPPAPTTVSCTFREVITPSLRNAFNSGCARGDFDQSKFIPGEILLNGEPIGLGQATVTLDLGRRYVVEFRKPSHPYFTFSDGSPSRYIIEAATVSTTLIESIFTPTFTPDTGNLSITTTYSPNIAGSTGKGDIFITGKGKVGTGTANVELEPGKYTVYFGALQVPGMLYNTPEERVVEVKLCETTTTNGNYTGVPLPTAYWLKGIDGVEKLHYNNTLTKGMFSENIANLLTFYSSSVDRHYTHVYHRPLSSPTSSIQFSVAYGNFYGSGSNDEGGQISDTPTRAIYAQYRNIILGSSNGRFNLSGTLTDHFYAISYQKDRRDTRADYNALEINLAHLSGSEFIQGSNMIYHTGSNVVLGGQGKVLRLISDYKINPEPERVVPSAPIEYNIVSGSIEDGVFNQTSPHYYGKIYPSLGVVLLDANKLDVSASFGTVTSREVEGQNQLKLFTAISGAAQYTDISGDYLGMKARATKEEIVYHYFLSVKAKEFNYTNNPSSYNTNGLNFLQFGVPPNVRISRDLLDNTAVLDQETQESPKTYITTIGLYDKDRNLLAVGKTSVPEFNSFTEEVMFNVKLKF